MAAEYAAKRRALVNPTEKMKDLLRRIYNKESMAPYAYLANEIFAGANVGGQQQQSSSVFGGTSSVFGGGGQQTKSVFGGAPATATQPNNPFAKSSTFGGAR